MTLADPVRAVIRQMDPNLPISDVRTLRDLVDRATAPTAFVALLLGVAALVAGTLGAIGVYGALSYAILQRGTEMGIRMALGATRGDLSGLVLRHAVVLAGVGTGLGLGVAWAAARAMESMLVGIAPHDVGTFASASVVLFLLAMLAAWLPARRAAVQSPSEVPAARRRALDLKGDSRGGLKKEHPLKTELTLRWGGDCGRRLIDPGNPPPAWNR